MMRAGFLQFNPSFGRVRSNLNHVLERLEQADADLVVLPELFNTGYQFVSRREAERLSEDVPSGYTTRRLCALARSRRIYLVAGIAERRGAHLYNSAVLLGPEGFIDVYRKAHLFYEEKLWFARGNTPFRVWDIGRARIGIMICFDWFFPEAMRALSLAGADIVCHPANLVLPHCPDAMITRSIENRVFSITSDRIGFDERGGKERLQFIGRSQIVSPQGEVLYRASDAKEEMKVMDIDPREARKKGLNRHNDLIKDRRADLYATLLESARGRARQGFETRRRPDKPRRTARRPR